jgi:hypothetical protein
MQKKHLGKLYINLLFFKNPLTKLGIEIKYPKLDEDYKNPATNITLDDEK